MKWSTVNSGLNDASLPVIRQYTTYQISAFLNFGRMKLVKLASIQQLRNIFGPVSDHHRVQYCRLPEIYNARTKLPILFTLKSHMAKTYFVQFLLRI